MKLHISVHKIIITLATLFMTFCGYPATISEVLKSISDNNLRLRNISQSNKATIAELKSENALPPTSIEYSPFFRKGESGMASSELVVSQEFEFPTLYHSRSKGIALEEKSLNAGLTAERTAILLEAKQLCIDLIYQRRIKELTGEQIKRNQQLLISYQRRLDLGESTLLEVNKIRLELQELNRELLMCRNEEENIKNSLIALNSNHPLNLENLQYDIPASQFVIPSEVASLADTDISVRAKEAELESAHNNISTRRQGWLPSLTIGYRRNTELREASNGFLVGAALPLFSNSGKVKSAKARLHSAEADLADTRSETESRLEGEINQLKGLREILDTYDDSLLQSTLELYGKSLEKGEITLTDYYSETGILYDRLTVRAALERDFQRIAASLLRYDL